MQDHLSDKVVNLLVNIMPLVYMVIAKDGTKKGNIDSPGSGTGIYGLGRFATGSLLSGIPMSKVRRETVLNSDKYMPIIQTTLPAVGDGKVLTQRDTMPQRTAWTTNHPASYFKRPMFKWCERVDPIKVPKKDIRRTRSSAPNEKAANVAVGDLFKVETESVLSTHLQWWNTKFWGTDQVVGTSPYLQGPSNQDADVWDNIPSLANACYASNIYGGVDRSLSANTFWRGNYVATQQPAVLSDLVNYANYTLGCAKKGNGINLLLCGATLFPRFADECRAKGGTVYYDGLPNMGEYGFTRPIARFNNTYVIYDPECPDVAHASGAYTTNAVAGLNLDTFTIGISPDANFTVDEPFDQSKVEGGDDAVTSNIRTELFIACEAPSVNVWFNNVG